MHVRAAMAIASLRTIRRLGYTLPVTAVVWSIVLLRWRQEVVGGKPLSLFVDQRNPASITGGSARRCLENRSAAVEASTAE